LENQFLIKMTKTNNFQVGAAKVDITPSLGTIIGFDFLPGYTHFIHNPLFVKSMIIAAIITEILYVHN
jgi:hypothetical protein